MADSRAALASWARFENVLGSANTAIRRACGTNSCRVYVFARSTSAAVIGKWETMQAPQGPCRVTCAGGF
jgi:hypothetical protein